MAWSAQVEPWVPVPINITVRIPRIFWFHFTSSHSLPSREPGGNCSNKYSSMRPSAPISTRCTLAPAFRAPLSAVVIVDWRTSAGLRDISICLRKILQINNEVRPSAQFYLLNTRWSKPQTDEVHFRLRGSLLPNPLDHEWIEPYWLPDLQRDLLLQSRPICGNSTLLERKTSYKPLIS
jgi:hypothetical protein